MSTKTTSLRRRLVWVSSFWITTGFLIAFFLLSSIFKAQATKQFYEELGIHVVELERLVTEDESGNLAMGEHFSDPRYDDLRSGYYWLVREGNLNKIKSPSFGKYDLKLPPDEHGPGETFERHKVDGPTGTLLFVEHTINPHPESDQIRQYIVGTDQRHLHAMVAEFNKLLASALVVFAIVMIASSIVLLRFAMAPLDRVRTSLAAVRAGDSRLLEGQFPQEVLPLVTEFNGLLESISDMLRRARAGAGNLAHGLKGPLTIISDESLEMTARGQVESAKIISDQSRIMLRHIDHHLARTRASIVARLPGMCTPLTAQLESLIAAMQTLHKAQTITVQLDIDPELHLTTDAEDLNEILGNILENAFKYAQKRIVVSARSSPNDMISITIEDDGPGVPAEAREDVFGIGEQWDERNPGNGLGLAIVKELTELYGGSVHLSDSPEGGLRVDLSLPAST